MNCMAFAGLYEDLHEIYKDQRRYDIIIYEIDIEVATGLADGFGNGYSTALFNSRYIIRDPTIISNLKFPNMQI